MTARPLPRPWTREEYHRAADIGLFHPDERLELWEGEVITKMSPQSKAHAWAISLSAETLRAAFGAEFYIREEKPLVLSDLSEPEPDLVVVRGTLRAIPEHPTPATALLVVEVSDTTLAFDRGEKAVVYARSGITEYWILNLRQRQLEVHRDPGLLDSGEHGYRAIRILTSEEEIASLAAPEKTIRVTDLLPIAETENAVEGIE